jgi:hypothetical protein
MRFISVAPLAAAAFATAGASGGAALADQGNRISGPHSHANLAVYFVHGVSAGGAVPLTLQEALAKGQVQVVETGRVNELQIENTGSEQVFIQAGDIVKGGKQDRVLTVSFLLPANSGRLPIARRQASFLPFRCDGCKEDRLCSNPSWLTISPRCRRQSCSHLPRKPRSSPKTCGIA